PSELARESIARDREPRAELLHVARDADHPAAVAEVAFDLAGDRRDGERGEPDLAAEIEAVDRLHEPERGDLLEVVQRLALVRVAPSERSGERQRALHQLQSCLLVSVVAPAAQKVAIVLVAGQRSPPLVSTPMLSPPFGQARWANLDTFKLRRVRAGDL